MFNSWFHIRSIAIFLKTALHGAVIDSCYTHHKNELVIGIAKSAQISGLRLLFENPLPYLEIETQSHEPRNRVPLFKSLTGLQIDNVFRHRTDRQILISLKKETGYLLLELYGMNGNIYHLDSSFQVMATFRKTKNVPAVDFSNFTTGDTLFISRDDFSNTLNTNPEATVNVLLRRLPIPVFSKTLIDEILYRAGLPGKTLFINLNESQSNKLYQSIIDAMAQIEENRYYIYESEPPLFALLPLLSRRDNDCRRFDSIIDATRHFISTFYRINNLDLLRRQLSNRLTRELEQLQRKQHNQQRDLEQLPTAGEFRSWADTLLNNIHRIQGHTESIDLPSPDNPDKSLRIPLNPKLNAAENANRYYEKSRQIDRSRKELADSIKETAQSIRKITTLLNQIGASDDLKSLQKIKKQIPEHLLQKATTKATEERKPYHHFVIHNHDILVGRSAKDNDELSFKHARPEDFWFHVEHGPGSHVVVRNPGKRESLSNEMIELAAGIAAFYSKAKHSNLVPVIYTKRKYIWKRKNMPPGKVFTKFTKSVIVKPMDPRK